jgi:hypothetical protein
MPLYRPAFVLRLRNISTPYSPVIFRENTPSLAKRDNAHTGVSISIYLRTFPYIYESPVVVDDLLSATNGDIEYKRYPCKSELVIDFVLLAEHYS